MTSSSVSIPEIPLIYISYRLPLYLIAGHEEAASAFRCFAMSPLVFGLLPSISLHLSSCLKAGRNLRTRTRRWILSRVHVPTLHQTLNGRYSVPGRSLLASSHILLLLLLVGCRARWHVLTLLHVLLLWPALSLLHVRALSRPYILWLMHVWCWIGWVILHVWWSVELTGLYVLSILHHSWWALNDRHLRWLRTLLALIIIGWRRSALWE